MEIGVRLPHTGSQASPDLIREWCTFAEQAGFGMLWGIDHIMMPEVIESKYTLARKPASIANNAVSNTMAPNFELMTSLTFAAAVTQRIKIGSAVAVLSLRNAVLNARQLASVDRYSDGRLLYGVGVGWMKEEADAMNMPWDRRGARADEHIALLRAIWTAPGRHVEFHGEFWDFPPMDPEPRPAQTTIPILIGGHSEPAIDRAARLGDGWIAAGVSPGRLAELLPTLRERADHYGRDVGTIPVYCRGGQGATTHEELRQFEALGVAAVQANVETLDDLKRFADETLPAFL
jgi:probable F420-dependent oxidoreductase